MPNDKGAVQDFLGDLNKDEKDPFTSSDPFAQVEEEVKPEEVVEEEEKVLPFHKDPKVQKYVQKQIDAALAEIRPSAEQQFRQEIQPEADEITDVLTRVIGNDTPEKVQAVKDMRKVMGSLEERGAQRALNQLQEQAQEQQAEDVAAQNELDSGFEDIEDSFGVDLSSNSPSAKKTRSDFVDYIRKIAPKNEDGEVVAFPDLTAAFEEFAERSKRVNPQTNRSKQLAAKSMSTSTDATQAPKIGNTWKDVDKLLNSMN